MRALLLICILAGGLIAGGVWMEYQDFLSEPMVPDQEPLVLEIKKGTSLAGLSEELTRLGLIEHPYLFIALAYHEGKATSIKAGEYKIPFGLRPPELLVLVTSDKVVQHTFTLVEGSTYRRFFAAVAKDKRLEKRIGDNLSAKTVMTRLGHPEAHPEGRFLPETYFFSKGTSDLDILRRAYETMERVLKEEWTQRDEGLPLKSPDEALILASIVEKEAGLASERPIIADVFIRRLNRGMKLQADPTVIYGLDERFDGNITRAHLRQDTPYNTYIHKGLPPTPIALPGRAAIHGVLHLQEGDALFFVAKGDGSHHFSATMAEHNRAVRCYQLKRRRSESYSDCSALSVHDKKR